jgi:hypothetical protein
MRRLRLHQELKHAMKKQPKAAHLLGNIHAAYYYGRKCIGSDGTAITENFDETN